MTLEEFLEKINEERKKEYSYEINPLDGSDDLYVEWVTGGQCGGSCWGTQRYPRDAESEPEFHELDKALESVCPDIKFLQYKRLYTHVVKIGDKENSQDYYGNWASYGYKKANLLELYEYLADAKLI